MAALKTEALLRESCYNGVRIPDHGPDLNAATKRAGKTKASRANQEPGARPGASWSDFFNRKGRQMSLPLFCRPVAGCQAATLQRDAVVLTAANATRYVLALIETWNWCLVPRPGCRL
jgi:hypothetical protein